MNLPNKLTILRIFFILPVFVLLVIAKAYNKNISYSEFNVSTICFISAAIIFIVAMFTDFLDGFLARKNNQITTFGKLFDPLADKIMTSVTLVLFTVMGITPIYFVIIFIVRDIVVDGSRNVAAANNINVAASWWGKWKTLLQSIGIILLFLLSPLFYEKATNFYNPEWEIWVLNIPLIIATFLSLISGYLYFKQIKHLISAK